MEVFNDEKFSSLKFIAKNAFCCSEYFCLVYLHTVMGAMNSFVIMIFLIFILCICIESGSTKVENPRGVDKVFILCIYLGC